MATVGTDVSCEMAAAPVRAAPACREVLAQEPQQTDRHHVSPTGGTVVRVYFHRVSAPLPAIRGTKPAAANGVRDMDR